MATMVIVKQELPELEFPLDYPACLDRIVKAAENRADYEINLNRLARMFNESIEHGRNEQLDCRIWVMGEALGFGTNVASEAKAFFSSLKDNYTPVYGAIPDDREYPGEKECSKVRASIKNGTRYDGKLW